MLDDEEWWRPTCVAWFRVGAGWRVQAQCQKTRLVLQIERESHLSLILQGRSQLLDLDALDLRELNVCLLNLGILNLGPLEVELTVKLGIVARRLGVPLNASNDRDMRNWTNSFMPRCVSSDDCSTT